jgi:superfamily II DNA or RNA helicase
MGSGKTLIAAATLSYHLSLDSRNKALFVVYDRNILYQTIKNFEKYGFNVSQYGDGVKDLSGDIVVAVINSLNNIEKPKEVLKYVTFVICDEAHHGKSKSSRDVLTKLPNCEYFIGLTATPHTDRSLDTAELQSILGPIIFEYGFKDGVADGKVAPVKAFFLDTKPDLDVKELVIDRKNYKFIWDTAVKENDARNKQLASVLSYCVSLLETPNLVLVDRVEHGAEMLKHLSAFDNIKASTMFGDDNIALREAKKMAIQDDTINTLISTVVKEGVDFPISPVIAVNASGRKSFISLIQFLGRITRPNEKFKSFRCYIDTVDNYHPLLKSHSQERMNACANFGVDVVVCNSVKDLIVEIIKHYKECVK